MVRVAVVSICLALLACHRAGLSDYPVSQDQPPAPIQPCTQLGPDECTRGDCTPIRAQQEIVDHPCVLEARVVGCMAKDAACADALTYARDTDNQVYWFFDTCIPEGWTVEPYPADRSEPPPSC